MKLSVIVPVYNAEQYLVRCIDSILEQDFSDFQLILIDDGSKDESLTMCQNYAGKDDRILVLHQENRGQASARNKALDICQGEYITFIDSDDSIAPGMFRNLMDVAQKHDADIVSCELDLLKEDGTRYKEPPENQAEMVIPESELLYNFYHKDGKKGYTSGVVCGKLYKRHLFETLRFPTGRIYEDTFIIPYLYEKTKMLVIITKPYYQYWIHQGSTVQGAFREKHLDCLYVMADQYHFFAQRPQYGQTDLAACTYMDYFVRYYYTVHLCHPESKPLLAPYTKEFRKILPQLQKNPLICKLEKLSLRLMLLSPRLGIKITRKYFPEHLPKELRNEVRK